MAIGPEDGVKRGGRFHMWKRVRMGSHIAGRLCREFPGNLEPRSDGAASGNIRNYFTIMIRLFSGLNFNILGTMQL